MKTKQMIGWLLVPTAVAGAAVLGRIAWVDHKKVKAYEAALKAPPREMLLTLTNREILNLGGAFVLKVSDDEWRVLTNEFKTNIRTDTLTFYKEPRK